MNRILEKAAIAAGSIALAVFVFWQPLSKIPEAYTRATSPTLEEKIHKVAADNLKYVVYIQVDTVDPKDQAGAIKAGLLGSGSGFFFKVEGDTAYIITNHHVIASHIKYPKNLHVVVRVVDRPWTYQATVVGWDEVQDVAVLRINKKDDQEDWQAVEFADPEKVAEGDYVVSIGHGMGLPWTISKGIITSTDRMISPFRLMVQSDAPINQGNSGGPLFDVNGRVVGVADLLVSPHAGNNGSAGWDGIGMSLAGWQSKLSAEKIIRDGKVTYPDMLIEFSHATIEHMKQTQPDVPAKDRSYVRLNIPNNESPGYAEGFRDGDIVLEINGAKIRGSISVAKEILKRSPGDILDIVVLRDKVKQTFKYKLIDADTSDYVEKQEKE
jgi:serine protease Do